MHISSFYAVKQFLKPTMWHICHHLVWVHLGASVFICTYIILPPGLATSVLCIHCSSGQVAVLTIPVGSTNIRILHPLKPLEGTLGKWGKRTGKGRGQGRGHMHLNFKWLYTTYLISTSGQVQPSSR